MMAGDRETLRALLGAIGAAVLLGVAALMMRAAGGAYGDDYELIARVERPGFNLDETSTVKIRGVTVGGVEDIELQHDGSVELVLHIRKEVRIPETATARIEPLSVFGPKFVDIAPGEDEGAGPFLGDGDQLAETVAPSEVVETLEQFSDVLAAFDAEHLATILTELARGFDGMGEDLGATVTAADQLSRDFIGNRPVVDELLADAVVVGDTFGPRGEQLVGIADRSASVLDVFRRREDGLGDTLQTVAQMSSDLAATIDTAAPSVNPLVTGLDRLTAALHAQLGNIPTWTASNERIARFLGEDLIQWDIGDGRLGGVTRAIVVAEPCTIIPTAPGCPAPEQADR